MGIFDFFRNNNKKADTKQDASGDTVASSAVLGNGAEPIKDATPAEQPTESGWFDSSGTDGGGGE